MKKFLTLLFSSSICFAATAQSFREIDFNDVKAGFNAYGGMFYNDSTNVSHLYSSTVHPSIAAAGLWIGGLDAGAQLQMAAETYRQGGADFWPGVLDTNNVSCDSARSNFYNNVWRMYCGEVDSFYAYTQGQSVPGFTVPYDIPGWPGNGDPAYGEGHYLAPFTDVDGDGNYNWPAGDYPAIKGQEALFYAYNDRVSIHTASGAASMGIEIHAMPYEFNLGWDRAVSNTVFIHYTIISRSTAWHYSTVIGLWSDLDLGQFTKSGCDSVLNAYYNYDSTNAVGVVFLNQPMNGYIAYNNDFSVMGNPANGGQYYNYLNQQWTDGNPLSYSGNGYGGVTPSRWMYSGDPASGTGWNSAYTFDQRNVGAMVPFDMSPGAVLNFDVAFVLAHDPGSQYAVVTKLKQYIADVRNFYAAESQDCSPGITSVQEQHSQSALLLYPNPATDQIHLNASGQTQFSICDALGQEVKAGIVPDNGTLDLNGLSPGIYFIRAGNAATCQTARFIITE